MAKNSLPIGLFDSGVGGLTILKEIQRQPPQESIIYLGDTQRLPYGNQEKEIISKYAWECSHFLMKQSIKLLIIACNTATSCAIDSLVAHLNIPIIGVIESTARQAASKTTNQKVGLLATEATIASKAYEKILTQILPHAKIISVACPLFVPLIEEGFISHPSTQLIVDEYLQDLQYQDIDTLILGCTHYLFLKTHIQQSMKNPISLVDSTNSCVQEITQLLKKCRLVAPQYQKPIYRFCVSGSPLKFHSTYEKLIGKIDSQLIEKVNINMPFEK